MVGPWHSPTSLSLTYTIKAHLPGYIIPPSDILDQLGKCEFNHNLPECFATASFFNARLHKYSPKALPEMKKFVADCRSNGETISKFELYDLEIDGSRWVAQGSALSALMGLTALNPFDCGELIDLWLGLPRKIRTKLFIHNSIFDRFDPALKNYPINPGKPYAKLQEHAGLYLLGTYAMFYLRKFKILR